MYCLPLCVSGHAQLSGCGVAQQLIRDAHPSCRATSTQGCHLFENSAPLPFELYSSWQLVGSFGLRGRSLSYLWRCRAVSDKERGWCRNYR